MTHSKKLNLLKLAKIDDISTGLSTEQIKIIQQILKQNSNVQAAILYGSRAKGNYKNGSDIDLTLLGSQLSIEDLLNLQNQFYESVLPHKVDLSIFYDIDNSDLIDHICQVGVLVFHDRS